MSTTQKSVFCLGNMTVLVQATVSRLEQDGYIATGFTDVDLLVSKLSTTTPDYVVLGGAAFQNQEIVSKITKALPNGTKFGGVEPKHFPEGTTMPPSAEAAAAAVSKAVSLL
jgi:hypothetical protein